MLLCRHRTHQAPLQAIQAASHQIHHMHMSRPQGTQTRSVAQSGVRQRGANPMKVAQKTVRHNGVHHRELHHSRAHWTGVHHKAVHPTVKAAVGAVVENRHSCGRKREAGQLGLVLGAGGANPQTPQAIALMQADVCCKLWTQNPSCVWTARSRQCSQLTYICVSNNCTSATPVLRNSRPHNVSLRKKPTDAQSTIADGSCSLRFSARRPPVRGHADGSGGTTLHTSEH
jgi:hypothetical protein